MFINELHFINFRNYEKLDLNLCNGLNIFTGDNAQGKTNVLEGIYYCSLAKSHRTSKDKELIKWDNDSAYVSINVIRTRLDKKIEIKIFKEGKKGAKINTIKINKISDLIGVFNVVMFSPEDLVIIKGSPASRRKLLDMELCQLSPKYYYNLVQYNKVLNERNTLLKRFKDSNLSIIEIYDVQLSKFGAYIIKERSRYIDKLNQKGKIIHSEITSKEEDIEFKYISHVKHLENGEEELFRLLEESRTSDIERRTTLNGPHREDFNVYINGINARNFGSQGQQRTSVLTIKFSSMEIIKDLTGEYPVLLLDDVLSELDTKRQKYILNSIKNMQTIISCTGLEEIKNYLDSDFRIFKVESGSVTSNANISQSNGVEEED